jgi:hypothetical protein
VRWFGYAVIVVAALVELPDHIGAHLRRGTCGPSVMWKV